MYICVHNELIQLHIDDIGNLLRALVPFGYVDEARSIQEKFEKFLDELKGSMETIFVPLQLAVSLVSLGIWYDNLYIHCFFFCCCSMLHLKNMKKPERNH